MYQSQLDLDNRFNVFKKASCFELCNIHYQAHTIPEARIEEDSA